MRAHIPEPDKVPIPSFIQSDAALSNGTLLDWLKPRITESMLLEIAKADAEEEWEEHLAAIEKQLSDDPAPGPLPWNPAEVLSLVHWSVPEWYKDRSSDYVHLKRLFACTLLVESMVFFDANAGCDQSYIDSATTTFIRLTESAILLGEETTDKAFALLVRLNQEFDDMEQRPFLDYCLFTLWLATGKRTCEDITTAWHWVKQEEAVVRRYLESCRSLQSDKWLNGLSIFEKGEFLWRTTLQAVLTKQKKSCTALDEIQLVLQGMV